MGRLRRLLEKRRAAQGAALMGVLNTTPDSFFDGGRWADPAPARQRALALVREGADVVDVGGESTRPGAPAVPPAEQWRRVQPALDAALALGVTVSIDTSSPEVADRALAAGATVVNDVSCLADEDLARVVARHRASLVLMHSRGPMSEMAGFSEVPEHAYRDVVAEVLAEWEAARDRALAAGVAREEIVLDPGLGFWKSARHSFQLLARLPELARAGAPILVGPSRKSFLRLGEELPPGARLPGTLAAVVLAVERGAWAVRVHDVAEARQALRVRAAVHAEAHP